MRKGFVIALTAVLTWSVFPATSVADDPSPEPPPDVTCRIDSGAGTLTAIGGPRETLLRISGAGYSGNATCTFKTAMPVRVKFHLVGVNSLQSFSVTAGGRTYTSPVFTGTGKSVLRFDRLGRTVTDPSLAAVTLELEATKANDVEVSLSTARGVELGKELKVNWIQYVLRKRGG
jgi:hypothetical protein